MNWQCEVVLLTIENSNFPPSSIIGRSGSDIVTALGTVWYCVVICGARRLLGSFLRTKVSDKVSLRRDQDSR